jgi:hypothetical protein
LLLFDADKLPDIGTASNIKMNTFVEGPHHYVSYSHFLHFLFQLLRRFSWCRLHLLVRIVADNNGGT